MHTDDCLEAREDACGDCGSVGFRFVVWSIASIHDHDVDDDDDDVNDAGKHDYGDRGGTAIQYSHVQCKYTESE